MERVVARDAAAFGVLVRGHLRHATALAYELVGDLDDAEDIVQEAFIIVWDRAATFDLALPFPPWLYGIVRNLARRRMVRAARRRRLLSWFGLLAAEPVSGEVLETADAARRIRAAADQLPEMQRLCFTLHFVDAVPIREIAVMHGVAESTVRQHLFRARAALRARLGDMPLDEGEAYA